jgi:predicted RNase H-like HicB family nuclease
MAARNWTREQKLRALMRLPWTVQTERNPEDGYLVARVVELPSVIATGDTEKELARDLWESLEASLAVYLDYGDEIPLPTGQVLPWDRSDAAETGSVYAELRGDAWEVSRESAMSASAASSIIVIG